LKQFLAILLLCFSLLAQSLAGNHYNNDWRGMPFIEMMATMMRAMNQVLGGNNSFANPGALPYSPALSPSMGLMPGLTNMNSLPMSPAGFNALPLNRHKMFSTPPANNANFWDLTPATINSSRIVDNDSLNGIWQTLSGDVIAIYNNNHFIWSNGAQRNLAGQLVIRNNKLIAYVPSRKMTLYFQFYREPGQFIVRDKNARIYTFKRIY